MSVPAPLRETPVLVGVGKPPPGATLASDRRAAGGSCPPLQPPPPGLSRDPLALGGRTGICPARPFVMMLRGAGAGRGSRGSCRPEVLLRFILPYEPPWSREPCWSPQAGSRPNLKSEPVGATSGCGCPAWRPWPGRGGGSGVRQGEPGGAGLGAPGWAPGSLSPLGLWVGPGAAGLEGTGSDYVGTSYPQPPGIAPGQAQPTACSEVAKSFGFSPLGWVHLPAWARVGGGFEPQRGHHLPCCVSSDNCLPSLSLGSSSVASGPGWDY